MDRLRTLTVALLLLLMCGAPLAHSEEVSQADKDRAAKAKYYAERYEMYDYARDVAKGVKNDALNVITLADIYRAKAKSLRSDSRREDEWNKAWADALEITYSSKSEKAKLHFYTLLFDRIEAKGYAKDEVIPFTMGGANRTTNAERAAEAYRELDTRVQAGLDKIANFPFDWLDTAGDHPERVEVYNSMLMSFYLRQRSAYVRGMCAPEGSQIRRDWMDNAAAVFSDFTWEVIDALMIPECVWDGYVLLGHASRAVGDSDAAVSNYRALPETMADFGFNPENYLVQIRAFEGYNLAAQVLLNDYAGNREKLEEAIEMVDRVLRLYPGSSDTPMGKELLMYGVAARAQIQGADLDPEVLNKLFELAGPGQDPHIALRASEQLANIAMVTGMSNELRIRCAQTLVNKSNDLNFRAAQVLHSVLANCSTIEEFESYAPYCYYNIGLIYEGQYRFLDAAVVYREGADRLSYFRDESWKESEEKLPAHFFNAEGKARFTSEFNKARFELATKGDAYELPALIGKQALSCVKWLSSSTYGDGDNPEFQRMQAEYQQWFAPMSGLAEQYAAVSNEASRLYNSGDYANAAEHWIGSQLGGSFLRDNYLAGNALALAATRGTSVGEGRIGRQRLLRDGYTLRQVEFEGQANRLDADFADVPKSLRDDLRMHLDRLLNNSGILGKQYSWELAQYALKRAILSKVNSDARKLEEAGVSLEGLTLAQAVAAHAQVINKPFFQRLQHDPTMYMCAKAAYRLSLLMVEPVVDGAGQAARDLVQKLRLEREAEALDWLSIYDTTYGIHIKAAIELADKVEVREEASTMQEYALQMLFNTWYDSSRKESSNKLLDTFNKINDFAKAKKDATTDPAEIERLDNLIRSLASKLADKLRKYELPIFVALKKPADNLTRIAGHLDKGLIEYYAFQPAEGEPAPKLKDIAPEVRRETVSTYLYNRILSEGLTATMPDDDVNLVPEDLITTFKEDWQAWQVEYTKLYKEALIVEVDRLIAAETDKIVVGVLRSARGLIESKGSDAGINLILKNARDDNMNSDSRATLSFAADTLSNTAGALQFGVGDVFRFEMVKYIEDLSSKILDLASTHLSKALNATILYNEKRGTSIYDDPDNARAYAAFFSTLKNHEEAYTAWSIVLQQREKLYGDQSFININESSKRAADPDLLAEELITRFELGNAAFELYSADKQGEKADAYLHEALIQLRRVSNVMQWRISLELNKSRRPEWLLNLERLTPTLSNAIDTIYIPGGTAYTQVLLEYAAVDESGEQIRTPDWEGRKYYQQANQFLTKAEVEKAKADGKIESEYFALPVTSAELLKEASILRYAIELGLFQLSGGFYRNDYREAFFNWIQVKEIEAEVLARKNAPAEEAIAPVQRIAPELLKICLREESVFDDASKAFIEEAKAKLIDACDKLIAGGKADWMKTNMSIGGELPWFKAKYPTLFK